MSTELHALTCTPDCATFHIAPLADTVAHNRRAWLDSRLANLDVVLHVGTYDDCARVSSELSAIRPDAPPLRRLGGGE
ncbi:MAG: hypothetical protein WC205_04060 [Opitutaceae bacterium]